MTITKEILLNKKFKTTLWINLQRKSKSMMLILAGVIYPPCFWYVIWWGRVRSTTRNFEELTSLNYFQMFWNKDLNKLIAEQTNLYSIQKDEKSIATIVNPTIQQFIGIHMLMLLVDLPSYMMYWVRETWYPQFPMSCL